MSDKLRNHIWTLIAVEAIEALISYLGMLSLRDFALLALGTALALLINYCAWEE